jgi:hypothetical protein
MKFYEAVMYQVATGLDPLFYIPPSGTSNAH